VIFSADPSSLSAHKTSASALAPPKPTFHTLQETSPTSSIKKRKKKDDLVFATEANADGTGAGFKRSTKKAKLGFHDKSDVSSTLVTRHKAEKKKKTKGEKDPMPEVVNTKGKSGEKYTKGKKKHPVEPVVSEGEDEAVEDKEQNQSSSDSEEGEGEYVPPVHESLARASRPDSTSSPKKSKKYVPSDETSDQRDSRTIFVGNVPSQVMTAKVSWRRTPLLEMFGS